MSGTRKGADVFLFQLMLLLCAIWGLQQVAIKLAAADIAPLLQVALRSGIAALLVGALMLWQRGWQGWLGATWGGGVLAGALFALEFFFIALGLQYTSASHMAVFLYTAPIFSALGLHLLLPSERLRVLQWLGVGVLDPLEVLLLDVIHRLDKQHSSSAGDGHTPVCSVGCKLCFGDVRVSAHYFGAVFDYDSCHISPRE